MNIKISDDAYLEQLSITDAEAIYDLIENDREMLEKYLYWARSVKDFLSTKKYIEDRIASKEFGSSWYKITLNGKVCGIKSVNKEKRFAEIGYWLSSNSQGKGLVSKSVSAISAELKKKHMVKFLEFHCLENNVASMSVAKRAGGKHVETINDYFTIDGKSQSLHIYKVVLQT